MSSLPILEFVCQDYHHFNAGALKRAILDYHRHVSAGGKMFWALAGALSTARLGIVLAPAIRNGLIHGLSVTGANIEESLLQMIVGEKYKFDWDYRYLKLEDDANYEAQGMARVTDTLIPKEAFDVVGEMLKSRWLSTQSASGRRFWHDYFYDVAHQEGGKSAYGKRPNECWLLAAAEQDIPIMVGGHADSSYGNYFASLCYRREISPNIVKSDIEYMVSFFDIYQDTLAPGHGCGYVQVGGGIAGDFAMCAVPSLRQDLGRSVPHWAYFCQVSDSITSFGSYSGAGANEKITWNKTNAKTPAHLIESDATLVVPIFLEALLEAQRFPEAAMRLMTENR
ncbi:deoxyhypusine synthase [Brucella endophytica]|uniref:Deoxyhypusine synthase n=1 Tax=Brucella endophytica TaxID=1963359 RepID=A0A916SPN9_9HYPH|nr:deoxyhypusine synthase family protein [Brucella endophytica]GGB11299.1 deoxyhypusine synthase [Brucella endophytica]